MISRPVQSPVCRIKGGNIFMEKHCEYIPKMVLPYDIRGKLSDYQQ